MSRGPDRRRWIAAAGAGLAGLWVAACDKLNADPKVAGTLRRAEGLTKKAQRLVTDRKALAREFKVSDISRDFRDASRRSFKRSRGQLKPPAGQVRHRWLRKITGEPLHQS